LAAAAVDQLDVEALTELQIAWKSPSTRELLDSRGAGVALRSLWIVCEAARALPDQAELRDLAAGARKQSQAAIVRSLETLEKKPDDAYAFTCVLYGTLAMPDDQRLRTKAFPLLTR
jgi:hypothetical protein